MTIRIGDLPVNIPPAPKCSFIVRHTKSNRIYMAGNPSDRSCLYFSEPNNPSVVKNTSRMYPTNDDGPVTGLATFVDAVVVFFKRSVWVWRGLSPEIDAIWQRVPMSLGTNSPSSITQITHLLTFVNEGGIYGISPAVIGQNVDVRLGKEYIINLSENKVNSIVQKITNLKDVVTAYDSKNKRYMLAYCDDGTGVNNKILVYDEALGAFSIWEGIQANDIYCRANGDVLIASKNYILRLSDKYFDIDVETGNEKPIKFEAEIKSSLESPMMKKLFTKAWVQIGTDKTKTTNYGIDVKIDEEQVLNDTVIVEPADEDFAVCTNRFRKTGKQLSVRITHETLGEGFRLYGIGVDVTPVRTYGRRV